MRAGRSTSSTTSSRMVDAANPLMESANKVGIAPGSDTRIFVGRDVWRVNGAKRQAEGCSACKRLPPSLRMACFAVSSSREIFAARDKGRPAGFVGARNRCFLGGWPEEEDRCGDRRCSCDRCRGDK